VREDRSVALEAIAGRLRKLRLVDGVVGGKRRD
jgi:hypothetical protein